MGAIYSMSRRIKVLPLLILIFALMVSFEKKPYVYGKDTETKQEKTEKKGGGGYAASNQLNGFGYTAKVYDSTNGLPTSDANYILCSDSGYIWIGGYSGIIRYDGADFERLDSYDGLTNSRTLYQDRKGRMWVGTNDNGLVILDEQRNRRHITDEDGLPSRCILSIIEDGRGNFIIGTSEGIAVIDKDDNIKCIDDSRLDSGRIVRLTRDYYGDIYGYCDNGNMFKLIDGKVERILRASDLDLDFITTIIADPNDVGKVYIGTESGLIYYGNFGDSYSDLRKIDAKPLDFIYWLSIDCDRVWAASHTSIGYIDEHKNFKEIKDLPLNTDIEMLTSDYQGNLWIASSTAGVMKIVTCNFTSVTSRYDFNNLVVYANYINKGYLYMGTEEGLYILDIYGNQVTNKLTEYIGKSCVRHIMSDSQDNLWLCVYNNGLGLVCQKKSGEIINFTTKEGLPSVQVRCSLELSDGTIVVGGNKGISYIKDFIVQSKKNIESLRIDDSILSLYEKDNDLYIGTNGNGIYILNERGLRHYSINNGLTSDIVMRIIWDKTREVFWVITSNSIQYIKNDIIVNVTSFPYNNCYDVYFKENGKDLWVLASDGIYCVNAQSMIDDNVNEYKHYNLLNGLPSIPTGNSYSFLDENSNLYVSSRKGVCKFNIEKFVEEYVDLNFELRSVICDGKYIYPDKNGKYIIPEGANRITFVPAILDYSETNPKIHICLEGVKDQGATELFNKLRPLEFTGLRYGTYNLHLQMLNQSGNEILRGKKFLIEKKPLLFEMALVQAVILLLFIIIGGVLAWRILLRTTISKQYVKLQETTDELARANSVKERFLANISNFLRTPLITIMGADEMILRRDPTVSSNEYFFSVINDAMEIKNASEYLLELIDSLIYISNIESGKATVNEKEYDTVEAMQSAISITRHLCNEKGLSFEFEVDEKMPVRLFGDVDKLSQIIWTLINNGVKYTSDGGVTIRATVDSIENNYCDLNISVKDTGPGISDEFKDVIFNSFETIGYMTVGVPYEFGLGLTLSRMFANLMNGTIEVSSEKGQGATFTFKVRQKIVNSTPVSVFKEKENKVTNGLYIPSFVAPEAEVLVVDNNMKSLNIIKNILKETKMFVGTATTGEECLEKIKFGSYNLVLMDCHMPDITASELLIRVRDIVPDIPVYAISSIPMEDEEFYQSKGFNGVLLKPVDSKLLEKTILKHIPTNIYMKLSDTDGYEEDSELPKDKEWLYDIKELNVRDGIRENGGAGQYLTSLLTFMDALNKYVNGIDDAYKNLDIKLYTVKMHSLRTSFAIVGAYDLAALSEALEAAGNHNDLDYIAENTDSFLSECRSLYTKLNKLHSL